MAKITMSVEIDTEEHTMEVSLNGKKVPNVSSISCYKYYNSYEDEDEISCNISSTEKDEEGGLVKNTTYYTMSSEEAKKISKADALLNIPGFIGQELLDPTQDISQYFVQKINSGV